MKKVLFLMIMLFIMPIVVNAQEFTEGTIEVIWGDYEDRMGERPDSFDVELLDLITNEKVKVTLDVKDATVTQVDGQTTLWEVPVKIPMIDSMEASFQYPGTQSTVKGYFLNEMATGGMITEYGGIITLVYFKDINKTIDYTFYFNDDGERDYRRYLDYTYVLMKATNSTEEYMLKCDFLDSKKDYCKGEAYVHAYYADADKRPIWSDPINYEFSMAYPVGDFVFNIDPDLDNNKVEASLNYHAKTIDDVNIKVKFLNGHEKKLKVNLMNQGNVIERTVEVEDEIIVSKLFKNMPVEKEIVYSLDVDDKDYKIEVKGNQKDGFVIYATYIENKGGSNNNSGVKPDDNNGDGIIPSKSLDNSGNVIEEVPNTYDDITKYIIMFVVSISYFLVRFIKKMDL